jgi:CDP-glucose 4,6-dehydratase
MNYTQYFKNKKVFVTGHTGFKGSWLSKWLSILGAEIYGVSLDIPTNPSHYELLNINFRSDERYDISSFKEIYKSIESIKPDYVFHLAAQPLVLQSYEDPYTTYMSNSVGTLNVLESLKRLNHDCSAVIITSDKCYENIGKKVNYSENDRLGGVDPYSTSKASAELIFKGYCNAFFNTTESNIQIASARAGNVIGGGDWALDRIVPDCMKSWAKKDNVILRNPAATRPWQHVLEPINGYLRLAAELTTNTKINCESFNFGPIEPESYTVENLVSELSVYFEGSNWSTESDNNNLHEANLLSLDCEKALKLLNYKSKLDFKLTSEWTSKWYDSFYKKSVKEHSKYTEQQIIEFAGK